MFDLYSEIYDCFYQHKDYNSEFNNIISVFNEIGEPKIAFKRVLEIGCGTGNFSKLLGAASENLLAIDSSESMVERALEKNIQNTTILSGSFNKLELDYKLTSIFLLFHVLTYFEERTLGEFAEFCRKNVQTGGFIIFDFWDMSSVRKTPPSISEKFASLGNRVFFRRGTPKFDEDLNNIIVDFEFYEVSSSGQREFLFSENHVMYPRKLRDIERMLAPDFELIRSFNVHSGEEYKGDIYGNTVIFKKIC